MGAPWHVERQGDGFRATCKKYPGLTLAWSPEHESSVNAIVGETWVSSIDWPEMPQSEVDGEAFEEAILRLEAAGHLEPFAPKP